MYAFTVESQQRRWCILAEHTKIRIELPENANRIIETLEAAGFEAYVVGGCVRDSVLGRNPGDWDITTSAKPQQVKKLFRRTVDTGIAHGTVTVMMGKEGYEVTTYRIDGEYTDHRRPNQVEFTSSLEEDLKRRDFTINAMAYSHSKGIIDLFGGKRDLENKIIRAVGDANDRFNEDALRILRAVRFAGQLGFAIEKDTRSAMVSKAHFLKNISAERIRVELTKLITSNHPEKLAEAYAMGITAYVLPEFDAMMEQPQNNPHHKYNVGMHSIEAVKHVDNTPVMRWAALLHDVGKPKCFTLGENGIAHFYNHAQEGVEIARHTLKRLRFDNNTIKEVTTLVRWHDFAMGTIPEKSSVRRLMGEVGTDFFPKIIQIKKADISAQSDYKVEEKISQLKALEKIYEEIIEDGDCVRVKDLKISGADLKAMGMPSGKEMGKLMDRMLDEVLVDPSKNDREYLLGIGREYIHSRQANS